jgi:hypothetical protein
MIQAHASTLLATLFYIEYVESRHKDGILAVRLKVKCRLYGQHLLDVIKRVGQVCLTICGKEHELLTRSEYGNVAKVQKFSKAFLVNVPDETIHIDVRFKGGIMDGASLSNCPFILT